MMRVRRLEIVPDSERAEALLLRRRSNMSFIDARSACTLRQLVEVCAQETPADPLLVRVLLARHAPLATRAFGAVAETPDFILALQTIIGQLRTQGVTPEQLAHVAIQAPKSVSSRALAVAELWQQLDLALEARGLVDAAQILHGAARRLDVAGLPEPWAEVTSISVLFVHDFFPARLKLLEALAVACHRAGVEFELHWPSSGEARTDVFVLDALRQVEARWQKLDAQAFPYTPQAPLAWLGAAAFAAESAPRAAPQLSIFDAASAQCEAREIARRVKWLVAAGTAPEEIAVAFRDLAEDTERLVEALAEVGIQTHARLGIPLSHTPVGHLALALLDLVEDDFPAAGVVEMLESPYVFLLPQDAPSLHRVFAEARIVKDGIDARLAAYQARLKQADADEVARLRQSVLQLFQIGRAIPAEGSMAVMLKAFWSAIVQLGLFEALNRLDEGWDQRGLLGREIDNATARDLASGEALQQLLENMRLVFHEFGEKVWSRRDFSRWFRNAMSEVNLQSNGLQTGAVRLLDVRALIGHQFKYLFLGACVDGRFPGRSPGQLIFSEADCRTLNKLAGTPLFRLGVSDGELALPTRLAEDRLLLHCALSSAQRGVTLSWPRFDDAGQALLESPFLDAIRQVATEIQELSIPRMPLPTLDELVTEDDLRARVVLELLIPAATRQTAVDARKRALESQISGEPWFEEVRTLVQAETERLAFFSDAMRPAGAFSGRVELLPALLAQLDRPVSPAQLNAWGQCAFRGFALHLLGLRAKQALGEELEAKAKGLFLHGVLERLVSALSAEGLMECVDLHSPALRRCVVRAVDDAAVALENTMPTGHPALWKLYRQHTVRLMLQLMEKMQPFDAAQVLGVEWRFGEGDASAPGLECVKVPAVFDGERDVYVRGRMDRVDVLPGQLGVVDYKISLRGLADAAEAFLTSDFQLPVYLWALRQNHPTAKLLAAWVSITKPEVRHLDAVLQRRGGDMDALLACDGQTRMDLAAKGMPNFPNALHGLFSRLRTGDFGARPLSCRNCGLSSVCRMSDRRSLEVGAVR